MAKLVETTYGEALFELAVQESKVDELCEEAQAVIDIFKDNEDLVNVQRLRRKKRNSLLRISLRSLYLRILQDFL